MRDDLKQEVILIVCSWPDEKIIKLYEDKALDFYVVKVILNQMISNSSPFSKKYRQFVLEYNHNYSSEREINSIGTEFTKKEKQEWLKERWLRKRI